MCSCEKLERQIEFVKQTYGETEKAMEAVTAKTANTPEEKAIGDYTIAEVKETCKNREYCISAVRPGDKCRFYDEQARQCKFIMKPCRIDLEDKKKFTPDQLATMREYHTGGGINYVARDKGGLVHFYEHRPKKRDNIWMVQTGGSSWPVPIEMFPQILWSDNEPVRLADYIGDIPRNGDDSEEEMVWAEKKPKHIKCPCWD